MPRWNVRERDWQLKRQRVHGVWDGQVPAGVGADHGVDLSGLFGGHVPAHNWDQLQRAMPLVSGRHIPDQRWICWAVLVVLDGHVRASYCQL